MELKVPFFSRYKNVLYYGLLILALVTLIAVRMGKRKKRHEAAYVTATSTFQKWDQVSGSGDEELKNLDLVLKKHPELTAEYEAQIGQKLLAAYSAEKARPYVEGTLKRTGQPYYSLYGQTSVTVSEGNYSQALEEALELKKQMLADKAFWEKAQDNYGSTLFAFNLMRIAVLYGELGDPKGELNAWKELKQHAGWDESSEATVFTGKQGFHELLTHFTVQESSLLDYIKTREEELSKP